MLCGCFMRGGVAGERLTVFKVGSKLSKEEVDKRISLTNSRLPIKSLFPISKFPVSIGEK